MEHPNSRALWTLMELRFLEQNYRTLPIAEIAILLGRSPGAVGLMADKLGCRREKSPLWTEEEKAIVRTHFAAGDGYERLMQMLPGRSDNAVFSMAEKMGVVSGRYWREEELCILKQYYPAEGGDVTRRLPGRNKVSVRLQASRLGIKCDARPPEEPGFHLWSQDEWVRLEQTMHLSVAEQAMLFPYRTVRGVEKARARLKRRQERNI